MQCQLLSAREYRGNSGTPRPRRIQPTALNPYIPSSRRTAFSDSTDPPESWTVCHPVACSVEYELILPRSLGLPGRVRAGYSARHRRWAAASPGPSTDGGYSPLEADLERGMYRGERVDPDSINLALSVVYHAGTSEALTAAGISKQVLRTDSTKARSGRSAATSPQAAGGSRWRAGDVSCSCRPTRTRR